MARSRGYQPTRRTGTRERRPRFVILCEGERTEPLYFEGFAVSSLRVIEVSGLGMNTDSLVQRLIDQMQQDPDRQADDQYWAVFDRDSFPAARVRRAFELAEAHEIKVAFSNEAFEIWYWYHFDYNQAATSRRDYAAKLSERLGRPYKKNDPALYRELLPMQLKAIAHARKIRALQAELKQPPEQANPYTTVDLLVMELRRYDSEILRDRAEKILRRARARQLPLTIQDESELRACQRADTLERWEQQIDWIPDIASLLTSR